MSLEEGIQKVKELSNVISHSHSILVDRQNKAARVQLRRDLLVLRKLCDELRKLVLLEGKPEVKEEVKEEVKLAPIVEEKEPVPEPVPEPEPEPEPEEKPVKPVKTPKKEKEKKEKKK